MTLQTANAHLFLNTCSQGGLQRRRHPNMAQHVTLRRTGRRHHGNIPKLLSEFGQHFPKRVRLGQPWARFDRIWLTSVQISAMLTKLGHCFAKFGGRHVKDTQAMLGGVFVACFWSVARALVQRSTRRRVSSYIMFEYFGAASAAPLCGNCRRPHCKGQGSNIDEHRCYRRCLSRERERERER